MVDRRSLAETIDDSIILLDGNIEVVSADLSFPETEVSIMAMRAKEKSEQTFNTRIC